MDHSTDSFVAAGGTTIFTQAWRPAGTPKARIVLVHGYGEHSGRYQHVADTLTSAGYVVATYDQRGHGRSGGPRGRFDSLDQVNHDLALYRDELSKTPDADLPQILLGHSMGGAVALKHTTEDHAPLDALVLSAPFVRNAADVLPPLRLLAPILGRLLPFLPTQSVPASAVSRDPEVVRAYEADPLVFHGAIPAVTAAALLSFEAQLMRTASGIIEPTLIMHGTEDLLAGHSGSEELVTRITNAELKSYPGLHHEIFNEPEQKDVLSDLVEWLGATVS